MIIDTHAHIGKLLTFDMTTEQILYSMDQYGVDFSLISNIEAAEGDHEGNPVPAELQKPQNQILLNTLSEAKKAPDRLGVLPWLKIRQELPDEEFISLLRENRGLIYGFKLHPFHSRTAPDEERLEPIYRLAAEYGLPVVSHTGGCEEAMSRHLFNAAKRHPELDFVMVHMDLGTDNREALDLLGRLPNLYGDTTWVPISTTLEAIRRYGSEKMLFGTDNPIDGADTLLHNRTGKRSLYQQYFHELKEQLRADEYENLMHKNAERIFHIK
ncbi:MAG: TatD family hydrolase [Ruminococcus sp.]